MSRAAETDTLGFSTPPICDTCGRFITEEGQECPALDDGVCAP